MVVGEPNPEIEPRSEPIFPVSIDLPVFETAPSIVKSVNGSIAPKSSICAKILVGRHKRVMAVNKKFNNLFFIISFEVRPLIFDISINVTHMLNNDIISKFFVKKNKMHLPWFCIECFTNSLEMNYNMKII